METGRNSESTVCVCVCVYIYVCVCACMCICVCVYLYTYETGVCKPSLCLHCCPEAAPVIGKGLKQKSEMTCRARK